MSVDTGLYKKKVNKLVLSELQTYSWGGWEGETFCDRKTVVLILYIYKFWIRNGMLYSLYVYISFCNLNGSRWVCT